MTYQEPFDVSFWPPKPRFGSNAIGRFQIGVSPIGTIPPFNWRDTVISQYANSPILMSLIDNFSQNVDQTANIDAFFDIIFDLDTAVGYGLDVWGRIVGVSRVLELPIQEVFFGFEQGLPGEDTFGPAGRGPFYSGATDTMSFSLTDPAYRQLIFAKAAFNITGCTIPAINAQLMTLFGASGICYVQDVSSITPTKYFGLESQEAGSTPPDENVGTFGPDDIYPFFGGSASAPMTMTFVFEFIPTPVQLAIILQSGVLPKPCGVAAFVKIPGQPPIYYNPPSYD